MLKLQPLIDRFVDDVLRAVRGASLDDLRDLLGDAAPKRVARSAARREKPRERPVNDLPVAAPKRRRTANPAERRLSTTARLPAASPHPAPADAPVVEEITDPERLLGAPEMPPLPAESAPVSAQGADAGEPPPSSERLAVGPKAALREGESLVRADGAAVVIRRAKRA
jgi:hypothetical protein